MAVDVTTLENIYHMITPADLAGAQKLAVGQKASENTIKDLLDIFYNVEAKGAMSMDNLVAKLGEFVQKVSDPDQLNSLKQILHVFMLTDKTIPQLGTSQYLATDTDGKTPISTIKFAQIIGSTTSDLITKNAQMMGIVVSNSAFLSPVVRNAEKVERFMNFLPTIVASRMVPFLEVEFAFNRGIPAASSGKTNPMLWEPSLLKFLMGGDQTLSADPSTGTGKMLSLQESQDPTPNAAGITGLHSVSGMEMFTAPQTLVNPSPAANGARYVDVLDPFRPFMSIESFSINVTPTVGLYSYKKGTLVLKLHDRSRLAEISDLLRPQIYQDNLSAPTLWITYGWRHPAEPGNPYADFINGNMLVREAYGIINSSFSFDGVGQVQITMELWTKGLDQLRTLRTNDGADKDLSTIKEMNAIAQLIKKNSIAQGLDRDGVHNEIRSYMLIEAAERGTYPDMSTPEIQDALAALKKGLLSKDSTVDKAAANSLLTELGKFYKSSDKKNLDFKNQLTKAATDQAQKLFSEAKSGADPFLPSTAKDTKNASDNKGAPHPLTSVVEAINAYNSKADINQQKGPVKGATLAYTKKAVSFAKLVSVFLANSFASMKQIDELQLYFYQLNDHAGAAAGTNLASFPIDMPVFLDQYREHVERRGTERLTIEEFLRLVIDAQCHDTRAIGYGFRSYFAPYDPANKQEQLKKGTEQEFENATAGLSSKLGPFQKPVIETYVETLFQAPNPASADIDLLHQYENVAPQAGGANQGRAGHYRHIMRIHFFDKTNSPYKAAGKILRGDSNFLPSYYEAPGSPASPSLSSFYDAVASVAGGLLSADGTVKSNASAGGKVLSNQDIKHLVSKTVPTLVFGGNASSIISANLASKQDPLLSTTQMLAAKQGKPSVLQPNGSGAGGLPLRVIPASLSMTTLGCPLLTYAQMFFVDFNTGTTIDNIYGLSGITHTLTPGKFESNLTFAFYDAYGKFESAPTSLAYFQDQIKKAIA